MWASSLAARRCWGCLCRCRRIASSSPRTTSQVALLGGGSSVLHVLLSMSLRGRRPPCRATFLLVVLEPLTVAWLVLRQPWAPLMLGSAGEQFTTELAEMSHLVAGFLLFCPLPLRLRISVFYLCRLLVVVTLDATFATLLLFLPRTSCPPGAFGGPARRLGVFITWGSTEERQLGGTIGGPPTIVLSVLTTQSTCMKRRVVFCKRLSVGTGSTHQMLRAQRSLHGSFS